MSGQGRERHQWTALQPALALQFSLPISEGPKECKGPTTPPPAPPDLTAALGLPANAQGPVLLTHFLSLFQRETTPLLSREQSFISELPQELPGPPWAAPKNWPLAEGWAAILLLLVLPRVMLANPFCGPQGPYCLIKLGTSAADC